jgi:dihydrofolate reductase
MTIIAMIAAAAENGVIGNNNKLPWEIKSEWQYFKRMTKFKPVIEGRLTFESRGKVPFKDRPNIVVTRNADYKADGVIITTTLEKAIDIAKNIAIETNQSEIMISGGAEIYRQGLPLADRLYLTEIHLKPEGDTAFPAFDRTEWMETKSEFHKALPGESADYTIRIFDRKR